jgi:hypothetical protein
VFRFLVRISYRLSLRTAWFSGFGIVCRYIPSFAYRRCRSLCFAWPMLLLPRCFQHRSRIIPFIERSEHFDFVIGLRLPLTCSLLSFRYYCFKIKLQLGIISTSLLLPYQIFPPTPLTSRQQLQQQLSPSSSPPPCVPPHPPRIPCDPDTPPSSSHACPIPRQYPLYPRSPSSPCATYPRR